MHDETITEEKEHLDDIFQKWNAYKRRSLISTAIGTLVGGTLIGLSASLLAPHFFGSLLGGFIPAFFGATVALITTHSRMKRFVRALSTRECEILSNLDEDTYGLYGVNASDLVREAQKLTPPKELLRASQQPEDDGTLLRAAILTNATPQEQLLRSTNDPSTQ